MSVETGDPVLDRVAKLFEAEEMDCVQLPMEQGGAALRVGLAAESEDEWWCDVSVIPFNDTMRALGVVSTLELELPEARLDAVCELVVRINEELPLGNFGVDLEEGRVRFRTSLIFGEAEPDQGMLEALVYVNWEEVEVYFPAFREVVSGKMSPLHALMTVMDYDTPE